MIPHTRRSFLGMSLGLGGIGVLAGCGIVPFPLGKPKRIARIGYLSTGGAPSAADPNLETFRQGMQEQGYADGQDYVLERRYPDGRSELLPALAAELVALPVDVIVAVAVLGAMAAKHATDSIPIVMANVGADPVALGLVASLARPGGNVTGTVNLNVAGVGKRVELLNELLPGLKSLAILQDLGNPANAGNVDEAQIAARALGGTLQVLPLAQPEDLAPAFDAASRQRAEALLVPGSQFFQTNRARVLDLAAQYRLPAAYEQRVFAEAGGLLSFGASQAASYRRAAAYVDKILKGARPADLPIEQPTAFDFVINLKTAQTLGITIPASVLAQATEIIQ